MPTYQNPDNSKPRLGGNDDLVRQLASDILDNERKVMEQDLLNDANFIEATKIAYEGLEGEQLPENATPEQIAKMGLDIASRFEYNLGGKGLYLQKISKASDEQKLGLLYLVDTLDKKDVTAAGVGRFFREMALDPVNYAFGGGIAARATAGQAIKSQAMKILMEGSKRFLGNRYATAAAAGATWTGIDDAARQQLEIEAKMREEYDPAQGAIAAGIGAVAGPAIVKGAELAGQGVKAAAGKLGQLAKEGEELAMQAAGGGVPPIENVKSISVPRVTAKVMEDDNSIILSMIKTDEDARGQGRAKQYIEQLVKYADDTGKTISLSPTDEFGSNKEKLKNMYKQFGFVENKGKNKDYEISETMFRNPSKGSK